MKVMNVIRLFEWVTHTNLVSFSERYEIVSESNVTELLRTKINSRSVFERQYSVVDDTLLRPDDIFTSDVQQMFSSYWFNIVNV